MSHTPYTYPNPPHRPCTFIPYLHTPRLTLEVFDDANSEQISHSLAILNDPINTALMGDYGIKTPSQHSILTTATTLLPEHLPSGESPTGTCGYIVRLGSHAPNGEIIGLITLASRSPTIPPDIGWGFHSTHHGRGYATEAAGEVLRYLTHELQGGFLNAEPNPIGIIAWLKPSHIGSVRVAEKIGMVRMGEVTGDEGEVEVVFGVEALCGGRVFNKEDDVVSFYGPGSVGVRCKAALLGGEA